MSAQHVRFSLTSALGNNKSPRLYWAACVIFVTPIVLCQFASRRHDLNILSSIVLCWGRNHFRSVSTKHLSMIRGNLARIFRATVHPRNKNLLSTASQAMMSVQQSITEKLTKEFKPVYLDVMNESYMHNVPKGSETHFKVVVVSSNFNDKPLIQYSHFIQQAGNENTQTYQRHRLVNEVLKEELATRVHALSIQAKTPEQWESSTKTVPKSPPCMGGSKR